MSLKCIIYFYLLSDFHFTKRTTHHITPVCEEKSISCQLIYIHEGQTPIFKCLTAINLVFKFEFRKFGGGEVRVGTYKISPAELYFAYGWRARYQVTD